jgi:bleomycin hydrolase
MPIAFYEQFVKPQVGVNNYVSVIHDPRPSSSYLQSYTVAYLGFVVEGRKVTHLNLPIDRLKQLVIKSIDDNVANWFGCDVGKDCIRSQSLLDTNVLEIKEIICKFNMTKADRLIFHESLMTHAMVLTGYHLDGSDKVDRFEVENSWGKTGTNDGYLTMTNNWFDELNAYEAKPIVLFPWDPYGSLAKHN